MSAKLAKPTRLDILENEAYLAFFDLHRANPDVARRVAQKVNKLKCSSLLISFLTPHNSNDVIEAVVLLLQETPVSNIDFKSLIEVFASANSVRIETTLTPILLNKLPDGIATPKTVSAERLLTRLGQEIEASRSPDIQDTIIKLIHLIPDDEINYQYILQFLTTDNRQEVSSEAFSLIGRVSVYGLYLQTLLDELKSPHDNIRLGIENLLRRLPVEKLDYDLLTTYSKDENKYVAEQAITLLRKIPKEMLIDQASKVLSMLNSLEE